MNDLAKRMLSHSRLSTYTQDSGIIRDLLLLRRLLTRALLNLEVFDVACTKHDEIIDLVMIGWDFRCWVTAFTTFCAHRADLL